VNLVATQIYTHVSEERMAGVVAKLQTSNKIFKKYLTPP
jgi:site-specific recombinase XerD